MTLPKILKVGPFTYDVKHETRLSSSDHQRLMGEAAHDTLEIRIDEGMNDQLERETFMHEALHVVSKDRGLELDEEAVFQFSRGVVAMMLDNPEIPLMFTKKPAGKPA